jgi:hypothetical protein
MAGQLSHKLPREFCDIDNPEFISSTTRNTFSGQRIAAQLVSATNDKCRLVGSDTRKNWVGCDFSRRLDAHACMEQRIEPLSRIAAKRRSIILVMCIALPFAFKTASHGRTYPLIALGRLLKLALFVCLASFTLERLLLSIGRNQTRFSYDKHHIFS